MNLTYLIKLEKGVSFAGLAIIGRARRGAYVEPAELLRLTRIIEYLGRLRRGDVTRRSGRQNELCDGRGYMQRWRRQALVSNQSLHL